MKWLLLYWRCRLRICVWFPDWPLCSSILKTCLCHLGQFTSYEQCAWETHKLVTSSWSSILSIIMMDCVHFCFHVGWKGDQNSGERGKADAVRMIPVFSINIHQKPQGKRHNSCRQQSLPLGTCYCLTFIDLLGLHIFMYKFLFLSFLPLNRASWSTIRNKLRQAKPSPAAQAYGTVTGQPHTWGQVGLVFSGYGFFLSSPHFSLPAHAPRSPHSYAEASQ